MDYKIYIPDNTYRCYVLINGTTLRGYKNIPANNTSSAYRDFYINSNYYYNDGNTSWSSYSTLPICLDSSVLTTDVSYRLDYDKILTIYLILFIFIILIPLHIVMRFFPKEKRVC